MKFLLSTTTAILLLTLPVDGVSAPAAECPESSVDAKNKWKILDLSQTVEERRVVRRAGTTGISPHDFLSIKPGSDIWATGCPAFLEPTRNTSEVDCKAENVVEADDKLAIVKDANDIWHMSIVRNKTLWDNAQLTPHFDNGAVTWLRGTGSKDAGKYSYYVYLQGDKAMWPRIPKRYHVEVFKNADSGCDQYRPEKPGNLCPHEEAPAQCKDPDPTLEGYVVFGPLQTDTGGGHEPDPDD